MRPTGHACHGGTPMSTTVTVSLRSLVVTAAVVTAVVASYTVGSARADAPATPSAPGLTVSAAPAAQDSIIVSGTGSAVGVPDQLQFSFTAHATASDVSGALAQASSATRRVLSALAELGVPRKDVQTAGLALRPVYDYSSDGPPVITGYAASQNHSVLVRELPQAGEALSAVVRAGGNAVRLGSVRLQIGDPDALLREARTAAFAEAKSKAQQYAAASGRRLGEVVSVREGTARGQSTPDPGLSEDLALRGKLRAVPVRRGSEEVTVRVSLVWAFA